MYKVMIVDDEIRSVELLKKYIDAYLPEHRVCGTYYNGKEALEAFLKEPADIVLIDIEMPVLDGLSLIEELNRVTHNYIPIIISSYQKFEYAKAAMKNGVSHYLSKPVDFDEVKLALEAAAGTLQFQRITSSDLSFDVDEQEEYWSALLSGAFTDAANARQSFQKLCFPFSYERGRGVYFQLRLDRVENWRYGKEALFQAVKNLIRMVYAPGFLVTADPKGNRCSFIMVEDRFSDTGFQSLIYQAKQILHADISVLCCLRFSSVEQLRTEAGSTASASLSPSDVEEFMSHEADIRKVIAYMNVHYGEDLSRSAMAGMIYMSDAYFSRCFKIITQTTFRDYLTTLRMEKAIELLKGDQKVQDIARQVGYANHTRFTINFRQYTSYTPSEYRSVVLKKI